MDSERRRTPAHTVNIGVFGWFNPQILVPSWFEAHGLLPSGETKEAKLLADTPTLAAFQTHGFELQVTLDRFLIWSGAENGEVLRDTTLRCFNELPHTPMRGIGLNHEFHLPVGDPEWLLRALAPAASLANEFGADPQRRIELEGVPSASVGDSATLRLIVERSAEIESAIYIAVIQEHGVSATDGDWVGTCEAAMNAITTSWSEVLERAVHIRDEIDQVAHGEAGA